MKNLILFILLSIYSVFAFGAGLITSISGSYVYHKSTDNIFSFYYYTRSVDGVISNENIIFYFTGSTEGESISLSFKNIARPNVLITMPKTVNNNQVSIALSSVSSGIYSLILNGNPTKNYLLIEDVETFDYSGDNTIQNMPLKFYTHYNSDYFPNSLGTSFSTLKGYLKEGWKKAWIKENNEWELCNGVKNKTGQIINTIPDDDNKFDIHFYDISQIQTAINSNTYKYFGTINKGGGFFYKRDGLMCFNSDVNKTFAYEPASGNIPNLLNLSLIDESTFLTNVISHEMLHSIQNSWVPYKDDMIDYDKRKWLIEGQARFLPTVLMGESNFLYNTKNVEMLNNSLNVIGTSYKFDTKKYLSDVLNSHIPLPLKELSYDYAVFWRHLYEHNFNQGTPTKTRMALLRETMKINTTAVLSEIIPKMDAVLLATNGNFLTFKDAIKDFSKRVYFYDKDWKDASGNKLNNWQDPNNCSFYETLASSIQNINVPIILTRHCLYYDNFEIYASYGFVPRLFKFNANGKFTFKFDNDPDNDNAKDEFFIKTFLVDNVNKIIKSEAECVLTGGVGSCDFNITNFETEGYIIIVTKTS